MTRKTFDKDKFFNEIKIAMDIEMEDLQRHEGVSPLYGYKVTLKMADDNSWRGVIGIRAEAIINGRHIYSRIDVCETSSYGYSYTSKDPAIYAKVYRSARYSKTKTYPERKDGSFNYKALVVEAISEIESNLLRSQRSDREAKGRAASKAICKTLRKEFSLSEYDSTLRDCISGNVKLDLPEMTEDQAREILNAMHGMGMLRDS